MPDPAAQKRRRSVLEHGVNAPEFAGALGAFLMHLDDMELALAGATWLSGDAFSLADAAALPYVLRLDHLSMTPFIEARLRVQDWLARVQALPAYPPAVDDWLLEPLVKMFRGNGADVWADVETIAAGL